jgi:hypothetical protein
MTISIRSGIGGAAGMPEEEQSLVILIEFFKLEPKLRFTEELVVAMARFGPKVAAARPPIREMRDSGSSEIREPARKAVVASKGSCRSPKDVSSSVRLRDRRPARSPREDLGMGRFIRPTLALVLALFMRPGPVPGPAATSPSVEPQWDESWYVPQVEDFQPSYDRDVANGGKQTWEQYWGWVKSFYEGNLFTKGWNARARWLVEGVRLEGEQKRLRTRLNALGRDICAEWSKDYDVRKIGSGDLLTWGKMLEKAKARDQGDGAELRGAIDAVCADQGRKIGSGAASAR